MNRYQFEDLISEYIENQLSLSKRKEFEAYLKKNPDSEELVYSIKDNIKKLNKMPQLTTSSTFNERLMESVGKSNYNPNEDKLNKIIFGFTSSCSICVIAFFIASEDPCTSDLIIILSSSVVLSLKAESCVTKVSEFFPC